MHLGHIRKIIEFSFITLHQDQPGSGFGVIHLLKILYLFDEHYARLRGETFTGIDWKFYHFGPWNQLAQSEIESMVNSLPLFKFTIEGEHSEATRWRYSGKNTQPEFAGTDLPATQKLYIRRVIQETGANRDKILRKAYNTPAMVQTKPGHQIKFEGACYGQAHSKRSTVTEKTYGAEKSGPLSASQEKKQKAARNRLKKKIQERIKQKLEAQSNQTFQLPRYDEVFFDGVKVLNQDTIPEYSGEIEFTESVWDALDRNELDIP